MTYVDIFDGDGAPSLDVVPGREPPKWTSAEDWVALSGISPTAHSLWITLKMHVNRNRDDTLVWPTTVSLALLMNHKRGDKVSGALKELESVGAITIVRKGMPRRNLYVVHSVPPAGYRGPTDLKQWYAAHRSEIDTIQSVAKGKRDARAAKKSQVSPVAPDPGQLG